MSSRFRALALGLGAVLMVLPGQAQIESSGLGDVDPWGANFLERGESGFGQGLWSSSDPEYLIALFEHMDVSLMSESEKALAICFTGRRSGAGPSGLADRAAACTR